jgi:5'-methylthioadenosine phosphorylase
MRESAAVLGVIGGSGLYRLDTPFGRPSDPYVTGRIGDQAVAFLPRHGIGHRIAPGELNYRANIHGFKQLGASAIVSISAVGSLREDVAPGHVVIPDQFIDRTRGRISTFFGNGCVAHVGFADPFCAPLSAVVAECVRGAGAVVHEGGTYVCMEGPMFSTRAESRLYRSWGASVIGMTNLQEAKLAREAEICFATIALATDYDCWRSESETVDVTDILAVLEANAGLARRAVVQIASQVASVARTCACTRALDHAVITSPSAIAPEARKRLQLLIGRLFE